MKSLILVLVSICFSFDVLQAQHNNIDFQDIFIKQNCSPLFGKDIILNDQYDQDQKLTDVCSAFNGWLYAAYTYQATPSLNASVVIMKSTDAGIHWSLFAEEQVSQSGTRFHSLDIVTTGTTVATIKLFIALVFSNNPDYPNGTGFLNRYNGETGAFEVRLFEGNSISYMALASDLLYPALNSAPGSLGLLYSKQTTTKDSLFFLSSGDGGITMNNKQLVTWSNAVIKKVSLCYGRSPSYSTGRYFAAWEVHSNINSKYGRIYSAHTEPNYNSPFGILYRLDDIWGATEDNICNPKISCQFNDVDNNEGNLTLIILFEHKLKFFTPHRMAISCYYSLKGVSDHGYFDFSQISDSLYNTKSPDIFFNPYTATFNVSSYDSTNRKLMIHSKDINMVHPDSWATISNGYNDNDNLKDPYPRANLNYDKEDGMNVWIAERQEGNGVAMFDAPYSTYVSNPEIDHTANDHFLHVFPNPCDQNTNIHFVCGETERVTIELMDLLGRSAYKITEKVFSVGSHQMSLETSSIKEGSYILLVKTEKFSGQVKLLVIR